MTHAAAVIGLTYDSVDLQAPDASIFLELEDGLWGVPDVRGSDWVVPGDPGRTEGNRVNDTLRIPLRGFVRGIGTDEASDREELAANRATIRTLFASNRARANLVALLEDGSTATISARPMSVLSDPVVPTLVNLSVVLEGYDDWTFEPAAS